MSRFYLSHFTDSYNTRVYSNFYCNWYTTNEMSTVTLYVAVYHAAHSVRLQQ